MKQADITGRRYGKLTAIRYIGSPKYKVLVWLYKCDCGNEIEAVKTNVTCGNTASCGCLKMENKQNITHGMSGTRFNKIYKSINKRCKNPQDPAYPNYGGRGIKNEWLTFEQFRNDMLESYESHIKEHGVMNTSIDRIDNNGGYNKVNCRWATRLEQNNNTRANRYLELNGKKMSMANWSRELGISYYVIKHRTKKGISLSEIMAQTATAG